jgi:hypothetical protein
MMSGVIRSAAPGESSPSAPWRTSSQQRPPSPIFARQPLPKPNAVSGGSAPAYVPSRGPGNARGHWGFRAKIGGLALGFGGRIVGVLENHFSNVSRTR